MQLRLFGHPTLIDDTGRIHPLEWQRPTVLLARLALGEGWQARDRLATWLRPDADSESSRAYLRRLVHRMRDLHPQLGSALGVEPQRLAWLGDSDVRRFEAAVAQGHWQQALGWQPRALLDDMATLGEPALDDWVDDERRRLRLSWRSALMAAIEQALAEQQHEQALAWMKQLSHDDPLDEDGVQFLLQHARTPLQRQTALTAFDSLQRLLALDMALKPLPLTQQLARDLRGHVLPAHSTPRPTFGETAASARIAPAEGRPGAVAAALASHLFGRSSEYELTLQRLRDPNVRLVTLHGPGGVGKTHLARAVHAALSVQAQLQAIWVDLAGVVSARSTLDVLASAMGVTAREGPTIDALAAWLNLQPGVVFLDNIEQLVGDTVWLAQLMQRAPGTRWVLTSRELTGLPGEHLVALHGLPGQDPDAAGCRLFAAHAARLGHPTEPRDGPAIVRLVNLLQGLPLAIELAASWVPLMRPAEIADALAADLGFLNHTPVSVSGSTRSLRSVMESSWARLDEVQRQALAGLTVMHDGLDREAAQAVAQVSPATLLVLAGRSLVLRSDDGRFRLHALVRQFVAEKLGLAQRASLAARHARHFLQRLCDPAPWRVGEHDPQRLSALSAHTQDIAAAWRTTVDRGDVQRIDQSLSSLEGFLFMSGRYELAVDLCAVAADALPAQAPLRARLDAIRATALAHLGRSDSARQLATQVLEDARDTHTRAVAHLVLSRVQSFQGRYDQALPWAQQALSDARQEQDPYLEMRVLQNVAMAHWSVGRLDEAQQALQRMLTLSEAHGAPMLRARAQRLLAIVRDAQGRAGEALELLQASLRFYEEQADDFEQAFNLRQLSYVHGSLGQREQQLSCAADSVRRLQAVAYPHELGESLFALALALDSSGQAERAHPPCVHALKLALQGGKRPLALRCLAGLAVLRIAHIGRPQSLAVLQYVAAQAELPRPDLRYIQAKQVQLGCTQAELDDAARAATALDFDDLCGRFLSQT